MSTLRIVNKRAFKPEPGETVIYIGRGSPLGNPFSHLQGTRAQYQVANRDEAVDCYHAWLHEKLKAKDQEVRDALNEIFTLAKAGPVALMCYCAPARCHGEIIKELVDGKLK